MRKSFFAFRVTEHWNSLSRVVVESPLEILEAWLDVQPAPGVPALAEVGLGDLPSSPSRSELKMSLLKAGGWPRSP